MALEARKLDYDIRNMVQTLAQELSAHSASYTKQLEALAAEALVEEVKHAVKRRQQPEPP
jgi:hypothetical protein